MRPRGLCTTHAGNSRRRGAVLILFALLLVAIFGLAALTLDVGMARLSQSSMQTAVDGACLEGLRGRDIGHAYGDLGADFARRKNASRFIHWNFDEDLQLVGENDERLLGVAPLVSVENGVGELNALGTLVVEDERVWRPDTTDPDRRTEINLDANMPYGDVVSGRFLRDAVVHLEDDGYDRTDFVPSEGGDRRDSVNTAFLARMRLTDGEGIDDVQGISSSGPRIPFLWGLGTTIHGMANGQYDPRREGLTVRATAIADARRVVRVGHFIYADIGLGRPVPGVLQIGTGLRDSSNLDARIALTFGIIDKAFYQNLGVDLGWNAWDPDEEPRTLRINTEYGAGVPFLVDVAHDRPCGIITPKRVNFVGALCPAPTTFLIQFPDWNELRELQSLIEERNIRPRIYVPVVKSFGQGVDATLRVIGFGALDVHSVDASFEQPTFTVKKVAGHIAPQNATTRGTRGLANLDRIPGLWLAHRSMPDSLLSATLVR